MRAVYILATLVLTSWASAQSISTNQSVSGKPKQAPTFMIQFGPAIAQSKSSPSWKPAPPKVAEQLLPELRPKLGSSAETALKPGLYETSPYSCLVLIPGPHPDDRAIIGPKGMAPRIPTVKPDLRFVPRSGAR